MAASVAAAFVGLSPQWFSYRFRCVARMTFREARMRVKVHRAIELLQTNRSIEEITEALGYSERSKLEKTFKRVTGLTPAYRRQHP